jgi:hypothetical protein
MEKSVSPEGEAQARFDQCQALKEKVKNLYGYLGKLDCNTLPSDSDPLPEGWSYTQVPSMPFLLPLPTDAEFAKTQEGIDVYPLSVKERDGVQQSNLRFFLSIRPCTGIEWCTASHIQQNARVRTTWVDFDRELFILAYEPGAEYKQYAFTIFSSLNQYFVEMHHVQQGFNVYGDQFDKAMSIISHIRLP